MISTRRVSPSTSCRGVRLYCCVHPVYAEQMSGQQPYASCRRLGKEKKKKKFLDKEPACMQSNWGLHSGTQVYTRWQEHAVLVIPDHAMSFAYYNRRTSTSFVAPLLPQYVFLMRQGSSICMRQLASCCTICTWHGSHHMHMVCAGRQDIME